jgi:hypothetical protein
LNPIWGLIVVVGMEERKSLIQEKQILSIARRAESQINSLSVNDQDNFLETHQR